MSDDIIGLWAVNGSGRVGFVQRKVHYRGLRKFEGRGIDGQKWDSACPHVLGPFEQAYFNGTIERQDNR